MKKRIFALMVALMVIVSTAFTMPDVSVKEIVLLVIGIIEVVIRVIPTVGTWSPIGIILKLLNFLSEFLDRKK